MRSKNSTEKLMKTCSTTKLFERAVLYLYVCRTDNFNESVDSGIMSIKSTTVVRKNFKIRELFTRKSLTKKYFGLAGNNGYSVNWINSRKIKL